MQLKEIKVGQRARIIALNGGKTLYRQRLIDLGLLPGTELVVVRMAPLGDPVEIAVRGFALSLRKEEASVMQLEVV